jgi:amphi-Trp domain-containing protein
MLSVREHAMTEQDPTEQATTKPPTETTEATDAPTEVKAGDEDDEDEKDDEKDDDEKKSKKKKKKKDKDKDKEKDEDDGDKPKKLKIEFEASMPRDEAISYFEAIIGGLRSGRLEFKQGEQTLVLNPPDRLEIEVKAQSKGDESRVVFEIQWSNEHRVLEIKN